MERLLIDRGLQHLITTSPLVLWEIISDASTNITSLMKPYTHLQHSLDIWLKAKKLTTSLSDIARKPECRGLLQWIRPIVNHLWWCCSTCKGSVERLLKRWMGILHIINNKHVWAGGRCRHSEKQEAECSNWLHRDTVVFKNLRMLVTKDWCGSMKFYTNCRQTWAVDNFFSNTLLHYCPKQKSFMYDAYHVRNMLAVMDHNNHLERMPLVGQDGECMLKARYPGVPNSWLHMRRKHQKILNTCIFQVMDAARFFRYVKMVDTVILDSRFYYLTLNVESVFAPKNTAVNTVNCLRQLYGIVIRFYDVCVVFITEYSGDYCHLPKKLECIKCNGTFCDDLPPCNNSTVRPCGEFIDSQNVSCTNPEYSGDYCHLSKKLECGKCIGASCDDLLPCNKCFPYVLGCVDDSQIKILKPRQNKQISRTGKDAIR
uniref:Uncharacterized protein n=1 Tax=Magallana gigas TaxID=29159 RepID=A0A8W8MLF8_MAGGI